MGEYIFFIYQINSFTFNVKLIINLLLIVKLILSQIKTWYVYLLNYCLTHIITLKCFKIYVALIFILTCYKQKWNIISYELYFTKTKLHNVHQITYVYVLVIQVAKRSFNTILLRECPAFVWTTIPHAHVRLLFPLWISDILRWALRFWGAISQK